MGLGLASYGYGRMAGLFWMEQQKSLKIMRMSNILGLTGVGQKRSYRDAKHYKIRKR